MRYVFAFLTLLFCSHARSEIVDFTNSQVIQFTSNPILSHAIQNVFDEALVRNPGPFVAVKINLVNFSGDHWFSSRWYSNYMYVDGALTKCQVPPKPASFDQNVAMHFTYRGVFNSLQELDALSKISIDAQRAYDAEVARCTVPMPGKCDFKITWDSYFAAEIFTLKITPKLCPALGLFTPQSATLRVRPLNETQVEFSPIEWQ